MTSELTTLLDAAHDAMIAVDATGRITLFNSSAERLTGIDASKAIGTLAQETIPNTRLHIVLQTGEPELNQVQSLGANEIITNRVPVFDQNGRAVAAIAVFRTVNEVRDLAAEVTNLREIQTLLHAIIHSTQDAISVVDANGIGILINPAYTRLTGLEPEDVIGKSAEVDIAEGESVHLKVLQTRQAVRNAKMKVGHKGRDVIVNVAPILVGDELKGSVAVIHDVSEMRVLSEELERARKRIRKLEAKYTFEDIVGRSVAMTAAIAAAKQAAQTKATVLLRGESGCGKELFAHAIHNASDRKYNQFVRVNCAAINENLLESELFGYVEGAFTGARKGGKKGLFEEATDGTIFLDEIAELSMNTQAKLLRVLQEREIVRVGASAATAVNVRVIAATHVNLEQAISQGKFREDLYYRLNVLPIVIPPLRHRVEDIPLLTQMLIERFNHDFGRSVKKISEDALARLCAYDWPGNVRELENVIGRAMIQAQYQESTIELKQIDLPDSPMSIGIQRGLPGKATIAPLADVIREAERNALVTAIAATHDNKTEAARLLGISVRSLYYKLERLGLADSVK
ncbi:sigma-54 interaction domain-containing protein [Sulfoacidibacillus thermotolerans]|uniref:Sigma-54-dependent Fis family transcriptional regulator n=1 Tax=Sulfoacidibacillus thermotolerans TaxID=1765684 RepID=A0A2U3DBP8_SULT2|nr:sigma 54-interacting transcriptional regulator [Sulfoacidibacillus thermotolerans]PWI58682.1 sigma-54-dependent Fis family transcriptional regulator [Sulfoacidibacillus thermotolerans]